MVVPRTERHAGFRVAWVEARRWAVSDGGWAWHGSSPDGETGSPTLSLNSVIRERKARRSVHEGAGFIEKGFLDRGRLGFSCDTLRYDYGAFRSPERDRRGGVGDLRHTGSLAPGYTVETLR